MRTIARIALGALVAGGATAAEPPPPVSGDPESAARGSCSRADGAELVSDRPDATESAATVSGVAVGRALTPRLGGFVELFGVSRDEPSGSTRTFFDSGLTWAVTADLQLDLRAGLELGSGDDAHFVGVGAVWRP